MEKKPKVIAFYRDHPSIGAIVAEGEEKRKALAERRTFLKKQWAQLTKDEQETGKSVTDAIVAECERLKLLDPGELVARGEHVHYDVDTLTVQRCNHNEGSMLAQILGFQP